MPDMPDLSLHRRVVHLVHRGASAPLYRLRVQKLQVRAVAQHGQAAHEGLNARLKTAPALPESAFVPFTRTS